MENIGRRQCIPILYTKGTHYEVGYNVGRTFSGLIQSFVNNFQNLNKQFIPAYETTKGRIIFDNTLNNLKKTFPQYIRELEGTADGSGVPFYKLFLLHLDDIILSGERTKESIGCSSICLNKDNEKILGHTEDALSDTLNHFYFVSAHIIESQPQGRWNTTEEKFTSLCYAGHLPGYTMSYNHHGLIFSINTLSAKNLVAGKTPRNFITRALLSAENFIQAQKIIRDSGCGAADGCSFNMTFLNEKENNTFYNIEMSPDDTDAKESKINILKVQQGDLSFHCNMYLRIATEQSNELMISSSQSRHKIFEKRLPPTTKQDVIDILGTNSEAEKIFFNTGCVLTIAVGIFDCSKRTWSLYSDNPKDNEPLVVLPLIFKNN